MDDTGLSWQQRLGDWWQDDKPWLREAPRLESEKQRDWFFWQQKRGVVVAGRMSAEEGKKVALWAQTLGWPQLIWRCALHKPAAAAVCRSFVPPECQSDQRAAAGANCGATGKLT